MRRYYIHFLVVIMLVAISMLSLVGCGVWIREYDAVRDTYEYSLDESIPFIDIAHAPTTNESRGFRGEAYINLGMGEAYPGKGIEPMNALREEVAHFSDDDAHLVQVYVYLGKYYDTDIDEAGFRELREYFELADSLDVKILLRFAYETGSSEDGPRTADIERHARQIKAFMLENSTLIHRTVYAVQLGMIGLWGEGHGAHHRIDVCRTAIAVADMIPMDIPLMVRTPEMLREVPKELESRYGVHDDFLVGYDHEWGMMDWTNPNYPRLLNKCKYTVTDAEMPWGSANERIDMIGVVSQCVGYGLTSLSIAHNYNEEGNAYVLEQWKDEYLTRKTLEELHFPFNPSLLVDGKISVYDYLKYHLGYQLVASNLRTENGKATFMLTNYGMALPYGYDLKVYVDGVSVPLESTFHDTDLMQFGQHTYSIPYTNGTIAIRLVNTRDTRDTIRLFNDIPFINGTNIIYEG